MVANHSPIYIPYGRSCRSCGNQIIMEKTRKGWVARNLDGTFHPSVCAKDAYGSIVKSLSKRESESREELWRSYAA